MSNIILEEKIGAVVVDEDVYDSLMTFFGAYGSPENISLLVNKCLRELVTVLRKVDTEIKGASGYRTSLSSVVKSLVEGETALGIGNDLPERLCPYFKGGSCIPVLD